MDTFPNECFYEILLLLNPKYLQLCGQINNNFNELCQLESLWRNQIENKYNELFKKNKERNYYKNYKMYYKFSTFRKKLDPSKINVYRASRLEPFYKNPNMIQSEIEQMTNSLNCPSDYNASPYMQKKYFLKVLLDYIK